jgi:serine protease DegQ
VAVEVQGKPVADATAMLNVIAALPPGEPARMKLKRQGQDLEATVNVGRRPRPQPRAAD